MARLSFFRISSFLLKTKILYKEGPAFIKPLVNGDDTLCPVKALELYHHVTCRSPCNHLLVHPVHLGTWNLAGLRLAIVSLIKAAQPDSFPRAHDLRKFSTSLAFFKNMKMQEILAKTVWKSRCVFRRHNLVNINEVIHQCTSHN